MEVLDVLIAARAEVEKGWVQGTAYGPQGETCLVGAMFRVTTVPMGEPLIAACEPLTLALGTQDPYDLIEFNNAPSTTKVDVLALFDRAINAEAQKLAPVSDSAHTFTTAA